MRCAERMGAFRRLLGEGILVVDGAMGTIEDPARRRKMPLATMERWLARNVGCEPRRGGAGAARQAPAALVTA